MFWKIKTDHTATAEDRASGFDRTGHCVGFTDGVKLFTAKLYDDDGELYYTVLFDREAWDNDDDPRGLYGCFRWAMNDAGVTDLRVRKETYQQLSPGTPSAILDRITRSDGWVPVYA